VPTNVVTVTVDENKKDVTIDDDKETVINIPSTITDATLDVASLTNDDGVSTTAILPEIAINAITSISSDPVIVNIPNGVQVEAPVGWDGTINVPTIQSNSSVTATPESGYTSSVSSVIEIGYGNIKLVFDKAVRILIPDQANQYVGYSRNGIFTQITNTCSADSQIAGDALSAEGDCKIRVGNDLVIWTKHFTKFITYTQSAIQISSSSSGTSSGQRITPQGVVLGASTERKTLSELLIELKKLILEYKQTKGSIPKEWEKYLDNQSTVIASKISEIVRNLSFTLSGEDVKTLQQFLINQDKGEYAKKLKEAGATGSFGLITKSALIEYQNNVGIKPALGYFGRITKDYLKSIGY